jgi:archaemetzincin
LLFACNQKKQIHHANDNPQIVISIQPFNGVDDKIVNELHMYLRKLYPYTNVLPATPIFFNAYHKQYHRYRADSIINILGKKANPNEVIIALTTNDISTTKDNYADWGVMGLGFCPGKACVASTFRLSKKNIAEQLFKVAIHELGHTQGLPHCANLTCYMRDAKGKNPTNEETGFCDVCKPKLVEKGWIL